MSDLALRVSGLSKRFRIGHAEPYQRLSELPGRWTRSLGERLRGGREHTDRPHEFWALRDVSFDVKQGEVLGIIGRNGAGKSTLLKIISRITEPTAGEAELWGRLGSLLEVGTGFHPELTGRENIYLNGAILGMQRSEITRAFDQIVAFAEVDQFLDTPVKHYSSGMYTRLAFAVAAHLEPEILIIDEVLSVGDIGFQKKCIQRMGEVSREGRTVITVSHNMELLSTLCTRSIWIDQGRVVQDGETEAVIAAFKRWSAGQTRRDGSRIERVAGESKRIAWVELFDDEGEPATLLEDGGAFHIRVALNGELPAASYFEWSLSTSTGQLATSGGTFLSGKPLELPTASGQLQARIGPVHLAQGSYMLSLRLGTLPGHVLEEWSDVAELSVVNYVPETGGLPFDQRRGIVALKAEYFDPACRNPVGEGIV